MYIYEYGKMLKKIYNINFHGIFGLKYWPYASNTTIFKCLITPIYNNTNLICFTGRMSLTYMSHFKT